MSTLPSRVLSLSTMNRTLLVVVLVSIAALALGSFTTLNDLPPIPERVELSDGTMLFTADDLRAGKSVFLKYNLMSYGWLLGNGAYYGPDFTAEYLHMVAEHLEGENAGAIEAARRAMPVDGVLQLGS